MPEQDTQPLYRVLHITRDTIVERGQPPIEAFRIDFTVVGAGDQYIFVPESDFDPDKIDAQVADWAAKIASVLSIEGPPVTLDEYGRPNPPNPNAAT